MKTILTIIACGFFTFFFSCGLPSNQKNSIATADTLHTNLVQKALSIKRRHVEEEHILDSLRLDKVLNDAVKMATKKIDQSKFHHEYEVTLDNKDNVKVDIHFDCHFTKSIPHLIIRRFAPGYNYIDIFVANGNTYQKVLSHKEWVMTYVNDTIRDINGDGLNDFVVNWYGTSGCCLKAFSNIYLLRPDKKTFSDSFEFINPTFSPNEQMVRGICYGHPGETEMYKYRWNKETIDTVEYISYEKNEEGNKTGKIIISNHQHNNNTFKVLKRLNSVPNEYKKIEGFDWFNTNIIK